MFQYNYNNDTNQKDLVECYAAGINSLLIYLLNTLRFSNILRQVKNLAWIKDFFMILSISSLLIYFIYNHNLYKQNFLRRKFLLI